MGKGGFPGGGFGGGNMQQILKQAQKMQADMQRAQPRRIFQAAQKAPTKAASRARLTTR